MSCLVDEFSERFRAKIEVNHNQLTLETSISRVWLRGIRDLLPELPASLTGGAGGPRSLVKPEESLTDGPLSVSMSSPDENRGRGSPPGN